MRVFACNLHFTHIHTHPLSLTHSHIPSLTHSLTHSHTHSLTLTHSPQTYDSSMRGGFGDVEDDGGYANLNQLDVDFAEDDDVYHEAGYMDVTS